MMEWKFGKIVSVASVFFLLLGLLLLSGCKKDGGNNPTTSDSQSGELNANGIREDIQQYIDSSYPDSARKRAAVVQYAKLLQKSTEVTTEAEAQNLEPQIIKSLSCASKMGVDGNYDSPFRKIDDMIINTPEMLEGLLRYEKFLDGKVFTISSPGDTAQTVCSFDPNYLPN